MKILLTSIKAERKGYTDDLLNRMNKLGYSYNLVNSSIQGTRMKRPVLDFKNINEFYKFVRKTDERLILSFDDGGNPCAIIFNSNVRLVEEA